MKKLKFNSGRLYDREGQKIAAVHFTFEGKEYIWMEDTTRNCSYLYEGHIPFTKEGIMERYDSGDGIYVHEAEMHGAWMVRNDYDFRQHFPSSMVVLKAEGDNEPTCPRCKSKNAMLHFNNPHRVKHDLPFNDLQCRDCNFQIAEERYVVRRRDKDITIYLETEFDSAPSYSWAAYQDGSGIGYSMNDEQVKELVGADWRDYIVKKGVKFDLGDGEYL